VTYGFHDCDPSKGRCYPNAFIERNETRRKKTVRRHSAVVAAIEWVSREAKQPETKNGTRKIAASYPIAGVRRTRRQPRVAKMWSIPMNEFNAVSMDELTEIEGGHWYNVVGRIAEKVAVAVITAVITKKLT
jgi:hypothetical protein